MINLCSNLRPSALVLALALGCSTGVHVAAAQFLGRGTSSTAPGNHPGLGVGSYDTKERVTPPRVVSGTVLDKGGAAAKGALVYLKLDDKKGTLKSVVVDENGKFRFVGLSRTVDYKLWAQAKDGKSAEKTISQFDTKDEIERQLRIE